jgi:hypothetical protein
MLKGIDINETFDYVCSNDPDKDKPTVFVLRNIPHKAKFDALEKGPIETLIAGVKEIRGFVNVRGEELPPITEVTEDLLNQMPLNALKEVLEKIIQFNGLSEYMKKNLPGQSGPRTTGSTAENATGNSKESGDASAPLP